MRTARFVRSSLLAVVPIVACATATIAQLHTSDVVLRVDGGVLTTNAVLTGTGSTLTPQRVFVADLLDFGTTWFANDPGFDSLSGTFAPGTRVGLELLGSLRVWANGSFATISPDHRARVSFGPQQRFTPVPPSADAAVAPIYASSGSTGQYHIHFGFTLQSQPDVAQVPSDGVYLLPLRVVAESGAIGPSARLALLLNKNASPEQVALASEAAVTWLGGVPACRADVAGANQSTMPDGALTADDIIVFLGRYFAGDARADVAGANQASTPDGALTADDIIVFLGRFFAGCS